MKHPGALLGTILGTTLVLSTTVVLSGLAAGATAPEGRDVAEQSAAATVPGMVPLQPAKGFYWQLTTAQTVEPGTVLLGRAGRHARSAGTRSDDEFFQISSTGDNDVPDAALRAYHRAERVMAHDAPGCDISWTLLAAIGRVESNHGRFGGAELGSDGISRPAIRGPRLDGAGPFAAIRDTDGGRLDRDKLWDRAVGQMQFLPETWRSVARDGDGDGDADPFDIDDSALGSAVYLCGAGGSLANAEGMARAAFRYNHSDYYVRLVLSFQAGYQTGVFALPSPPPPAADRVAKTAQERASTRAKKRAGGQRPRTTAGPRTPRTPTPNPGPSATPPRPTAAPKAPQPKPKPPAPKPTPVKPSPPAPPPPTSMRGAWTACGAAFCLDTTPLDLGPVSLLDDRAAADFDGDGTAESNALEFAGLVGKQVIVQVVRNLGGFVVQSIEGHGFRNADGTFARSVTATP
jgi:membrane-bound lytic murein transglycosylase B